MVAVAVVYLFYLNMIMMMEMCYFDINRTIGDAGWWSIMKMLIKNPGRLQMSWKQKQNKTHG